VDGLSAATGCYVGRRTLRIEDYGKTAVTFVDTFMEQAIRITPQSNIRELAWDYSPSARNKWETQLIGYQHISDELLFHWQEVELIVPVKQIIGQAGKRVSCEICGEEIINQREVIHEEMVLCKSCAGRSYFRKV
jgi:formylmethanofuran dehydrogenase subunit E